MSRCSKRLRAEPLIFVLIGPGGAGKGTLAAELVATVPGIWLSRSWTTRPARPGEREREAYVFVDRPTFEAAVARGEFFEWAEFMGNLMGTPIPSPPPGSDVLLEIEVQGAEQVKAKHPDATVILLLPPSLEVQAARLAARGEDEDQIRRRVEKGVHEVEVGKRLADHIVVNDDLGQALSDLTAIVAGTRSAASGAANPEDP